MVDGASSDAGSGGFGLSDRLPWVNFSLSPINAVAAAVAVVFVGTVLAFC